VLLLQVTLVLRDFGGFVELGYFFDLYYFVLNSLVDLQAFLNHLYKLVYLLHSLSVPFFLLLNDFQRTMLLAEDSVATFSIHPIHFHKVIGSPGALYME
jgi:hypothetical protein